MKKRHLKNLLFLLFIVQLLSCTTDDVENVEYHRFSELDREQLLLEVPRENDIISYKNQSGETISLRVQRSENGKLGEYSRGTFSGGGGHLLYYYDSQLIEMEFLDIPDPFPTFVLNISKTQDNTLNGRLYFELWNKPGNQLSNLPERLIINFETITTQIIIDGRLYTDVLVFNSMFEEVSGSWFGLDRNVNVIYYDKKYGLIGFDDLNGNNWRLN